MAKKERAAARLYTTMHKIKQWQRQEILYLTKEKRPLLFLLPVFLILVLDTPLIVKGSLLTGLFVNALQPFRIKEGNKRQRENKTETDSTGELLHKFLHSKFIIKKKIVVDLMHPYRLSHTLYFLLCYLSSSLK